MQTRMGVGIVLLLAIQTVYAAAEPITSNPIPERIVKRGIAVEVVELARLPDTRGIRPADQDVTPAGWARINYVRDLPDGRRFANNWRRLPVSDQFEQSAARVRERGGDVPACGLQPTEQRVHRVCLPSGVRAKRPVLHGARGDAGRAIRRSPISSRPATAEGRDLPQRRHGVARDESGRRRVCGHPARAPAHRPPGRQPDASAERGRVQPDGQARERGLRLALHQRQRSWIQQRRRAEPEQSRADTASQLGHHGHPAHRSAQSVGDGRAEGVGRLPTPMANRLPRWARPRWAKSTPTDSATPTGCLGTPTGPCSPTTSACTTSKRSTSSTTAATMAL